MMNILAEHKCTTSRVFWMQIQRSSKRERWYCYHCTVPYFERIDALWVDGERLEGDAIKAYNWIPSENSFRFCWDIDCVGSPACDMNPPLGRPECKDCRRW